MCTWISCGARIAAAMDAHAVNDAPMVVTAAANRNCYLDVGSPHMHRIADSGRMSVCNAAAADAELRLLCGCAMAAIPSFSEFVTDVMLGIAMRP